MTNSTKSVIFQNAEPPEPLTFQHADSIMNKQDLLEIVGPAARLSYYYRSFSCFFAKIFTITMSFRMIPFPPREAMTTAEPPEPLTLLHSEFILFKQILQQIVGPAARHSCPVVSIRGSIIVLTAARPLHEKSVYSVYSVVSLFI